MLRLRSRGILAACLVGTSLGAAPAALGFELFGFRLWGREDEADRIEIIDPLPYTVEVTVTGGGEGLVSVVENASSLWGGRDQPASGRAGLISKARGDYRRILAALYGEGYYGPGISIRAAGAEVADLTLAADLPAEVPMTIRVEAGPKFRFGVAEIVNGPPLVSSGPDEVDTPASVGFRAGETARTSAVGAASALTVFGTSAGDLHVGLDAGLTSGGEGELVLIGGPTLTVSDVLSAGFIEPLEATGISLANYQIYRLLDLWPTAETTEADREFYNEIMRRSFEWTRDFIAMHFCLSARRDTEYWRHVTSDQAVPDSLRSIIGRYDERWPYGPINSGEPGYRLTPESIACILAGYGRYPRSRNPYVAGLPTDELTQRFIALRQRTREVGQLALKHDRWLMLLNNHPDAKPIEKPKNAGRSRPKLSAPSIFDDAPSGPSFSGGG